MILKIEDAVDDITTYVRGCDSTVAEFGRDEETNIPYATFKGPGWEHTMYGDMAEAAKGLWGRWVKTHAMLSNKPFQVTVPMAYTHDPEEDLYAPRKDDKP